MPLNMDSKHRRKRKKIYLLRPNFGKLLILFFSILLSLFLLFCHHFDIMSFRPVLNISTLSLLPLSHDITHDSFPVKSRPIVIEGRILMPDHLLLIVSTKINDDLDCVYYEKPNSFILLAVQSVDEYHESKFIARCKLPPLNYSAAVDLQKRSDSGGRHPFRTVDHGAIASWEKVVYEAVLDGNSTVVFVKGFNLRPHVESDHSMFKCHFGHHGSIRNQGFVLSTAAIAVAQEVIRCSLPISIQHNPDKGQYFGVTISRVQGRMKSFPAAGLPSVAKIYSIQNRDLGGKKMKHEFCACSMLWNQASFLREWIIYHAWLGVQRWFIYDNNSDDELRKVVYELNLRNYNITRHAWPWNKAQEAGFSHCALRARSECKWVAFFDVDEFFYLSSCHSFRSCENFLGKLVANYSTFTEIAEIRTNCHSFGPSGLTAMPSKGVMVGYTCRLQAPERHKSIVKPELLHASLLNLVHHFMLPKGYRYVDIPESIAIVNHYKYQVWDAFKTKFHRRVSTYVANWQEDQNVGSKDRAPGLGTMPIEPPNWSWRFCEVQDTGLKDFVVANFIDSSTGSLPWET